MKKPPLDNAYIMKYIHPSLKNKKIIDVAERCVYQLIEQYIEAGDGEPRSYRATKKAHATLFQKRFPPLYLEHLSFLINRAGWRVGKLYLHYSFEQERFKRNLILMIQGRAPKIPSRKIFTNLWTMLVSGAMVAVT